MNKQSTQWILVLALFLSFGSAAAQAPDTLWTKHIGTSGTQIGYQVFEMPDGGFMATGYTTSTGMGDVYYVRTDSLGDTLWTRTYGDADRFERALCTQRTSDGGFVSVGGRTGNPPYTANSDIYVIKIGSDGSKHWDNVIGEDSLSEAPTWITPTSSGYAITGHRWHDSTGWDVYVMLLSPGGDSVDAEWYHWKHADYAYCIVQGAGGLLVAGESQSHSDDYDFNGYVLSTSGSGGGGSPVYFGSAWPWNEQIQHVRATPDGGYLLTGDRSDAGTNRDVYIVKVGAGGSYEWSGTYGHTYHDVGFFGIPTYEGGYLVAGTGSYNSSWEGYLIRLDAAGDTLWSKFYGDTLLTENVYCVQQTRDGHYITVGSVSNPLPGSDVDLYLAKIAGEPGVVPQFHQANGVGGAINSGQTTEHTINVTSGGLAAAAATIVDVRLLIDTLTHPNVGDLVLTLIHSGISDTVILQAGGTGDDLVGTQLSDEAETLVSNGSAPFTGVYRPYQPLAAFDGLDPSGDWTLRIYDGGTGNTGTLDAWGIRLLLSPATAVELGQPERPVTFALSQNYPNPFNPATTIEFALTTPAHVELTVYNVLGQMVQSIHSGTLPAGTHRMLWDGTDQFGADVASGMYFYRLESAGDQLVKKMMLVR